MTHKWIEISVNMIQDDLERVEVYSQKMSFEYFMNYRPHLIPEITELVNRPPNLAKVPGTTYEGKSSQETEADLNSALREAMKNWP